MDFKEVFISGLIAVAVGIIILFSVIIFFLVKDGIASILEDRRPSRNGQKNISLGTLGEEPDGFKEIEICGKVTLYKELASGDTIFIKPKSGRIRIGHLINHDVSRERFRQIRIKLHDLEDPPRKYQALGFEAGFLFMEIDSSYFRDWKEEYRKFKTLISENGIAEKFDKFDPISMEDYQRSIHIKSEKSLRKY